LVCPGTGKECQLPPKRRNVKKGGNPCQTTRAFKKNFRALKAVGPRGIALSGKGGKGELVTKVFVQASKISWVGHGEREQENEAERGVWGSGRWKKCDAQSGGEVI